MERNSSVGDRVTTNIFFLEIIADIGPPKLFSRCTLRLPENWIFFTGKKLDPEPMSNYENSRKIFLHFRFFLLHIAVDF